MRRVWKFVLPMVLACTGLTAQERAATTPEGKTVTGQNKASVPKALVPLIDRELIFGNPEIAFAQVSPDGKYLAFLKPWNDTRNIWVKRTNEPFSSARLLTTEKKRPIPQYLWSRDSKYILYVKDTDGDENFNLYAVDPSGNAAQGADAPPSRDLTGLKGVRVVPYSVPKRDPDVVYIGVNDRDKAWQTYTSCRSPPARRP